MLGATQPRGGRLLGITNASRAAQVLLFATLVLGAIAAPAQGAFPGQNGKLAFVYEDFEIETSQICTANQTGGRTCITPVNGPLAASPAWSPDGQKIAAWDMISDHLFTMNQDGSNGQLIRTYAAFPSWSPQARGKIVFQDYSEGSSGLGTVNVDGSGYAQLTTAGSDSRPDWSPDGSSIVFTRTTAGNLEIYAVSPDSGQEVRLTNTPVSELTPDFSPDGSKILFSAGGQLHTMNVDGTGRTPLPLSGDDPSWSPDGQKIVYERINPEGIDIYIANADGTNSTLVPTRGFFDSSSQPDWQPLPVNTSSTYVRPAGASPLRISLVPAAQQCTAGNRDPWPAVRLSFLRPTHARLPQPDRRRR